MNSEEAAIAHFSAMWGFGPNGKSAAWAAQGLRTVDDVRARPDIMAGLTLRERCGVRHAEDFRRRIPREVRGCAGGRASSTGAPTRRPVHVDANAAGMAALPARRP